MTGRRCTALPSILKQVSGSTDQRQCANKAAAAAAAA
jgi:hypothetical protein